MRVAILIKDLNIHGGTQKQVIKLFQYLKKRGYYIEIYTYNYYPSDLYENIEYLKVNYLRIRKPQKGNFLHYLNPLLLDEIRILIKIIRGRFDIINIHGNGLEKLIIIIKSLMPNKRIVWQINDLPYFFGEGIWKYKKSFTQKYILKFFATFFYRFIAFLVNEITVNVTKNKELIKKYYRKEAKVFYCGVDLLCDKLPKRNIKNKIKLVSTGVFFPYRNYEVILRAMKILADKNIECSLSIIGSTYLDPEYAESIRKNAESLRLGVKIYGEITNEELRNIYLDSHLFVFMNIEQSWGLAIFEAMSCGLPVIISNSVGATEVIKETKGVSIIDPHNENELAREIIRFVDEKNYYQFSREVFQLSRKWDWDTVYSQNMETLFKNILKKHYKK
jgi:glycosyltransferase involved in cell wall biosynthesis